MWQQSSCVRHAHVRAGDGTPTLSPDADDGMLDSVAMLDRDGKLALALGPRSSASQYALSTGDTGGVGAHGAGGEIGHITVNPKETAVCGCGKHGCLEQYSSATGVVRCMKKLLEENPDTPCVLRGTDFVAKDVFDAARSGDALSSIAQLADTTLDILLANNPNVNSDCTNLQIGEVCESR